jgi:hypothetical protein
MTTIHPVEKVCAVCGETSTHHALGPTSTMGVPDLDMRPAPLARWTLAEQIQQCPGCGYCAGDISVASDAAREMVRNEAYQAELNREDYPELTRRYLCASLILSTDGDEAAAGRVALNGAWTADDAGQLQLPPGWETADELDLDDAQVVAITAASDAAAHCRRLAVGYFEADRRRGLTFAADEATADVLLADLRRRVGDFEGARACAQAGIERGAQGLALEVLKLQVRLADFLDSDCHNMDEIGADEGYGLAMPLW